MVMRSALKERLDFPKSRNYLNHLFFKVFILE